MVRRVLIASASAALPSRYVPDGEWLDADTVGLGLAMLPLCHAECPSSIDQVLLLDEAWRALVNHTSPAKARITASGLRATPPTAASGSADAEHESHCDNAPEDTAGDVAAAGAVARSRTMARALNDARWYRLSGAAGERMLSTAPRHDERCGAEAAGWLRDEHPAAGAPPRLSTACFAYGWSDCLWSVPVFACSCSFDSGATVVHTYAAP